MMTSMSERKPTPTEARLIVRHKYQFYTNLIVGGVYGFPASVSSEKSTALSTYLPALKKCLDQHAFLSAVVRETNHGKTVLILAEEVDLTHHFLVHNRSKNGATEDVQIGKAIEYLSNSPDLTFFGSITTRPGWRVDVLPLNNRGRGQRVWIAFTYSHCNGDGRSGMIFQESFFTALADSLGSRSSDDNVIYKPKQVELPALPKLSVSFKYLLGPALGHYLPRFLSRWLGLKPSVSGADEGTWNGSTTFLSDATTMLQAVTAVEVYTIGHDLLTRVLQACRAHDTKLTSFLNVLIAQCMRRSLPKFTDLGLDKHNFVATIPTDIRRLTDIPENTIGNFSSAGYSRHLIDRSLSNDSQAVVTNSMWLAASENSKELSRQTSTLIDQPIGLLSWISNLDSWMKEQIGQSRDSSWQLSNLMTFNGRPRQSGSDVLRVEKIYFCQPADAVGQPLDFNTVSLSGGELVICVGWQVGAIGLTAKPGPNTQDTEREFVSRILTDLTAYLEAATK